MKGSGVRVPASASRTACKQHFLAPAKLRLILSSDPPTWKPRLTRAVDGPAVGWIVTLAAA